VKPNVTSYERGVPFLESMLIRQDNELVTVVFLDTIERQPV
jgi:hypothetical protein